MWLDGEELSASQLVLDRLLPIAEAGLKRQGINEDDVKRYLGVIDARCRSGRTGARWLVSSWNALKDKAAAGERANALVAATINRQLTGRPVSEWERARLDEADTSHHNYLRVDQYVTTDLFTVQADVPIEMVANLMSWERIRHVPVEDKDHRLVGLVTPPRGAGLPGRRRLAGGSDAWARSEPSAQPGSADCSEAVCARRCQCHWKPTSRQVSAPRRGSR